MGPTAYMDESSLQNVAAHVLQHWFSIQMQRKMLRFTYKNLCKRVRLSMTLLTLFVLFLNTLVRFYQALCLCYVHLNSETPRIPVGRYCGDVSPGEIVIPGHYAWVRFQTNGRDQYTGFQLTWNVLGRCLSMAYTYAVRSVFKYI